MAGLILLCVVAVVMLYNRMKSKAVAPMNRRQFERYKTSLSVTLSVGDPSTEVSQLVAKVQTISRGGVLMETSHSLSPGETVTISIPTEKCPEHLALPRVLRGEAEVVHNQDGKVGLRFTEDLREMPELGTFLDYIGTTSEPLATNE